MITEWNRFFFFFFAESLPLERSWMENSQATWLHCSA